MKIQVNMVANDAKEAAEYYRDALNAEIISQTDLETKMNESVISIAGTEIRILNENIEFGLIAPTSESTSSMWLDIIVDNIDEFFVNVGKYSFSVISPVTVFPNGAKNCVLGDKYNHIWVINQDTSK